MTAPGTTVLFIEDEDTLRSAVTKLLLKRNFQVIEAADGPSAIERFKADPAGIDVVLLDLSLPGMQGREVFEQLRRIRPDVKVILSTACSWGTAMSELGACTPSGYIQKPYKSDELVRLLQQAAGAIH